MLQRFSMEYSTHAVPRQCCISDDVEVSKLSESLQDHVLYQTVRLGSCHSESSQVSMPSVWIVRPQNANRVQL